MKLVKEIFNIPLLKHTKGEIGIEIEVEGENLPVASDLWRVDHDGSLKSAENCEYVLRKPLPRNEAEDALVDMYKKLNAKGTRMDESVKAGIHIHLNVQDYTLTEMLNFVTTYLLFEEVLVRYCGEFREGNHFCMRSSDAPYVINYLVDSIKDCAFGRLDDDIIRYCSINLMSLSKYGSLEFRAMRSTPSLGVVLTWIDMLTAVKEFALKFKNPVGIITRYSELDLQAYLHEAFGGLANNFVVMQDVEGMVRNGMRNAQEVAYCVNWDKAFEGIEDNIFYDVDQKAFKGNQKVGRMKPERLQAVAPRYRNFEDEKIIKKFNDRVALIDAIQNKEVPE